mmetsp:Transcript_52255/g.135467  ORF Transcript_52255/g.135467 Transcript_52255/m.135467 type:complete len:421 (+) Transcript_52255:20-1282(+)
MNVLERSAKDGKQAEQAASREASKSKSGKAGYSLAGIDALLNTGALDRISTSQEEGQATREAITGYLSKKAGGKHEAKTVHLLKSAWRRRFFVLEPNSSKLSYYKKEDSWKNGRAALGEIELTGSSTLFLKEVHNSVFRFTAATDSRELKMRASSEADYLKWTGALRPLVSHFRELIHDAEDEQPEEAAEIDDDDDDDDEFDAEGNMRDRSATTARSRSTTFGGLSLGRDRGKSSGVVGRDRAASSLISPEGRPGDIEGWLEKKQGGKEGRSTSFLGKFDKQLGKWERRYFVLIADTCELRYYTSPNEYLAKRAPHGSVSLAGASVSIKGDPKDVAKGRHRFTVHTSARELKLRADAIADCQGWVEALTREGRACLDGGGGGEDEELSDDETLDSPRNPFGGPMPAPPPQPPAASTNPFD